MVFEFSKNPDGSTNPFKVSDKDSLIEVKIDITEKGGKLKYSNGVEVIEMKFISSAGETYVILPPRSDSYKFKKPITEAMEKIGYISPRCLIYEETESRYELPLPGVKSHSTAKGR